VVSARNSNTDASGFSSASCNGVVTVAATGKAGNRSYYSKYGASGADYQSTSVTLSWGASSGAAGYQYCVDTSNNNACDGTWVNAIGTSAAESGLSRRTTYYWNVRATNTFGTTDANGGTWWSFSTR
jgi:serine protease